MIDDWNDHRGLWAVCEYVEETKNGGPQEGGWNWTRVEWVRMVALFQTREAAREYTILLYKKEDDGERPVALSPKRKFEPNYSLCGGDETVSSMHPEGIIPVGWISARETTLRVEPQRSEIHYGYWNQLYAPSYE